MFLNRWTRPRLTASGVLLATGIFVSRPADGAKPVKTEAASNWPKGAQQHALGVLLEEQFEKFLEKCPAFTSGTKESALPGELYDETIGRRKLIWTAADVLPEKTTLRDYAASFYTTPVEGTAFRNAAFRIDAGQVTRDVSFAPVDVNSATYRSSCSAVLSAKIQAGVKLPITDTDFKAALAKASNADLYAFVGTYASDLSRRLSPPASAGAGGPIRWPSPASAKTHEDLLAWYHAHPEQGRGPLWYLNSLEVAMVERKSGSSTQSSVAAGSRLGFSFGPGAVDARVEASAQGATEYASRWLLQLARGKFATENSGKPGAFYPAMDLKPLPGPAAIRARLKSMLEFVVTGDGADAGSHQFAWGAANEIQGTLKYRDGTQLSGTLCESGWTAEDFGSTKVSVVAKVRDGECKLALRFEPNTTASEKKKSVSGNLAIKSKLDREVSTEARVIVYYMADYAAALVGAPECRNGHCTATAVVAAVPALNVQEYQRITFSVSSVACEGAAVTIDQEQSRAAFTQAIGTIKFVVSGATGVTCKLTSSLGIHRTNGSEFNPAFPTTTFAL